MTGQESVDLAGLDLAEEATPAFAIRLFEQAKRDQATAAALANRADEMHARAEQMTRLCTAQLDLADKEAELAGGRADLVNVESTLTPLVEELARARADLASIDDPSNVLDYEQRIAARTRRLAVQEEITETLEPAVARRQEAVDAARATVNELEQIDLPRCRAEVAEAESWLSEPIDWVMNVRALRQVIPEAWRMHMARAGLAELAACEGVLEGTEAVPIMLYGIRPVLRLSGVLKYERMALADEAQNKGILDYANLFRLLNYINPPDPIPVPQELPDSPAEVMEGLQRQTGRVNEAQELDQHGHPTGRTIKVLPSNLPAYGSPEGQRLRAENARAGSPLNPAVEVMLNTPYNRQRGGPVRYDQ